MRLRLGLLLSCAVAWTACANPAIRRLEDELAEFARRHHAEHEFPGMSLAFTIPGGAAGSVTAGFRDRESRAPMRASDRMMSGSIGKTYVATVALQLVAKGKLSLDARVREYLGDREWYARMPNADTLTIRSLLNHTSGIRRYVFDPAFTKVVANEPDHVWSPEETLSYVFDTDALFPVGSAWAYADTNYILLGVVIEQLTGEPYYRTLQRNVLDAHALRDTVPTDRRRVPGLIPGYTELGKLFGIQEKTVEDGAYAVNPQFEWCGGGLACTTEDLARWARIYGAADAWTPELKRAWLDAVDAGPGQRYGLGVFLRDSSLGPVVGHSGVMPGYISDMAYYPDSDISVAVQFNTDRRGAYGSTRELLDTVAAMIEEQTR